MVAVGDPTVVGGMRFALAEGARWCDGRIVFVDILDGGLFQAGPLATDPVRELVGLDVALGAVAPLPAGDFVAAAGDGFAVLSPGRPPVWLARPERGRPGAMRMNDGVADPGGRFFAGSMDQDGTPEAGRLYRLDPDGSVHVVLEGLTIPNGPAFDDAGRRAYLADTAIGVIWRMDVDPATGSLGPRVEHVRLGPGEGGPDGMLVDHEGRLWVALWGAGEVARFAPDGRREQTIALPCRQPASVCLEPEGGRLWVASAMTELADPGPCDGALLVLDVAATARPADVVRLSAHAGADAT